MLQIVRDRPDIRVDHTAQGILARNMIYDVLYLFLLGDVLIPIVKVRDHFIDVSAREAAILIDLELDRVELIRGS